ncbi:MAG: hypothetical protein NWT02_00540 [Opitutales bacterium]|jgi:hypothetical protein|nr:hypothetical protein [Opitutales bacterium]MDP4643273.1 hypothetical protein [Opitutales bacterium]MDP4694195.1 hypothetical protein [Opitutales bacterium]MDP4777667.1 hypothetical protein [Opitutales bacterium]MDP4884162.1 hypothetical protein [Opitutales bacterium]
MSEPILESLLHLLSFVFGYEVGTNEFYVVLGVTLLGALVTARVLLGMFGGKGGFIMISLGVLLPIVFGGLAYAAIEFFAVSDIEEDWAVYIPWVGFAALVLGTLLVLSRRIFDLSFVLSAFIFLMSAGAGAGALLGAYTVVDFLDKSSSQLEDRGNRIDDEIENSQR